DPTAVQSCARAGQGVRGRSEPAAAAERGAREARRRPPRRATSRQARSVWRCPRPRRDLHPGGRRGRSFARHHIAAVRRLRSLRSPWQADAAAVNRTETCVPEQTEGRHPMTKYVLAGCTLALMVMIPRIAPAAGTAAIAPTFRTSGSADGRQPLVVASNRDLAKMLAAPPNDGSDSGDDGDDGDDHRRGGG